MRLVQLPEFGTWLGEETAKSRAQVDARLKKIEENDYFGDAKDLGGGLAELKWGNGRRVYFSVIQDAKGKLVVLILGGNKNGQSQDITAARRILENYQQK